MAVPVSHAALPAEGDYKFEDVSRSMPVFEVYAVVKPTETYMTGVVIVASAKCSKRQTQSKFTIAKERFPVTAAGKFSKSFKVKGEGSFGKRLKGKGTFKGTLNGTKLSGTVKAKFKDPDSGTCRLKGKFKATGKLQPAPV